MGAWGHGNFDNDDALDWVGQLVHASGPQPIHQALMAVGSNDPIDAPTASKAIAAAEVVAALAGRPAARLPVEIEQWLVGRTRPANALVVAAREAAERILSSSELKALWAESGEHEIWRSEVNGLVGRLFAASAQ